MIVPQPVSFQMVWPMIIQRKIFGSVRYLTGVPVSISVSLYTIPLVPKIT